MKTCKDYLHNGDEYIKREDAIKAVTVAAVDMGLSDPTDPVILTSLVARRNIKHIPAADVVPKSKYDLAVAEREANVKGFTEELTKVKTEVAREIFEEIEDVLNNIGYLDEIDFKALKKKYLPDTNDGNIVKDPEHRCIYCQEIIPQGRDVCGMCEVGMDTLKKYNKNNNQGG